MANFQSLVNEGIGKLLTSGLYNTHNNDKEEEEKEEEMIINKRKGF